MARATSRVRRKTLWKMFHKCHIRSSWRDLRSMSRGVLRKLQWRIIWSRSKTRNFNSRSLWSWYRGRGLVQSKFQALTSRVTNTASSLRTWTWSTHPSSTTGRPPPTKWFRLHRSSIGTRAKAQVAQWSLLELRWIQARRQNVSGCPNIKNWNSKTCNKQWGRWQTH